MSRILIAEDEDRIASFVEKGLRAQGYTTTVVADGDEALQMGRSGLFDLVLLDIGLPRRDGFTVLRAMREAGDRTPVIILTARDGIDDTVTGLEHGADDYVTKPFRFAELLARIRARLRDAGTTEATTLVASGAELDLRTRRIAVDGREEDLTTREFALADLLFRHAGQVLSREQILSAVWGFDHDPGSNVVDVYVGYLRKKLGSEAIETVRGVGYRLVKDPADGSTP
jgi:two-component system copper resistance phosphate regulon response regulator CusR